MATINNLGEVLVTPTSDRNVTKIVIRFSGFSMAVGPSFTVQLYNPAGDLFDSRRFDLTGTAWEDWPAATTDNPEHENWEYVISHVLAAFNLQRAES